MIHASVTGEGGVRLAARLGGTEGAPAILFVHGWSQHSLCWRGQFAGALADRFRLAAIDLRGHGASERPPPPKAYADGRIWAADIAAAIDQLGLGRPVVVGWSMGGWVLQDYLRHHGDAGIAGLVLVGSSTRVGRLADPEVVARRKPDVVAKGMYSDDQETQLEAAIAFARAMTAAPLSKHDLALITGWQMLVAPAVRAACRLRDEDWRDALSGVAKPALVVQGAAERVALPPVYEEMMDTLPNAEGRVYEGSGHMAFWEETARFDADLAGFAAAAHGAETRR